MDLNKITLIGHVVGKPKRTGREGAPSVVHFSLATNYGWLETGTKIPRRAVDFHDCVAFGKLADIVASYVPKGARLYVEGRLRNARGGRAGAAAGRTTEVVVDNMIMLCHRAAPRAAGKEAA